MILRTWKKVELTTGEKCIEYSGIRIYYTEIKKGKVYWLIIYDGNAVGHLTISANEIEGED